MKVSAQEALSGESKEFCGTRKMYRREADPRH